MKRKIGCCLLGAFSLLCILYGIAIASLNTGSAFYVIWFVIAGVFALLTVAVGKRWFARMPQELRRVLLGFVCLGLLFFLAVQGCILSGFGAKGEENLDYVIVLGAQVKPDGPGSILRRRLNVAIDYLNANPETICIVSGGQGTNEPWSEARGMADYLIQNGIDASRILLEDTSRTTLQNLTNSKDLLPSDVSVGIVTNNFHVFRALQMAKALGYTDVCGIAADLSPLYLPHNMLRETLAIIKYMLFPG